MNTIYCGRKDHYLPKLSDKELQQTLSYNTTKHSPYVYVKTSMHWSDTELGIVQTFSIPRLISNVHTDTTTILFSILCMVQVLKMLAVEGSCSKAITKGLPQKKNNALCWLARCNISLVALLNRLQQLLIWVWWREDCDLKRKRPDYLANSTSFTAGQ